MKKVIIYGFGMSRHSRLIKPDETVWTLNDYWNHPQEIQFQRFPVKPEVAFQVHRDFASDPARVLELKKHCEVDKCKVVVTQSCGLQGEELFDIARFNDELRSEGFALVGTVSYMLAYAYMSGVEEVELFGIDLICGDEYVRQAPDTLNAINILRKKGMKIIAPQEKNWIEQLEKVDWKNIPSVRLDYEEDIEHHIWIEA